MQNMSLAKVFTAYIASLLIAFAGPAAAQTSPPAEPSLPYTVRASDTLIVLAKALLVRPGDWAQVAQFNQMKDPNFIKPGQALRIPLRLMKNQPAPAQLISVSGEVTLAGQAATAGAALAEGVRLQTGANSSALVQLADGSRLTLLPGTLVEVTTQRHYSLPDASATGLTNWFSGLVRLFQGSLETLAANTARRATPLQVQTPTSLVGVRGTQFRVGYAGAGAAGASTEVLQGQVRADNPAQASGADLPGGTGAIVNPKEKEVKVVKLLAAPELGGLATEVFKPLGTLALPPLAGLPGAVGYRLQVAPSDKFEQIVRDLQGSQSVELGSLPLGPWVVRLRGIDGQGLEGFDAVARLTVQPEPVRTWQVLSSALRHRGGGTLLAWDGVQANGQPFAPAQTRYSAVLASDSALTQVLQLPQLPLVLALPPGHAGLPLLQLGDLKPGTYYLKLLAQEGSAAAVESKVYRFDLPGNWGSTVLDIASGLQPLR
ncbi:MAG: FecR domain-containing protein [Burkholderiaceae bacterium]